MIRHFSGGSFAEMSGQFWFTAFTPPEAVRHRHAPIRASF
jgi:hypothetical protein